MVNSGSAIKSRTKAQAACHTLETTTAFISLCKPKQVDCKKMSSRPVPVTDFLTNV